MFYTIECTNTSTLQHGSLTWTYLTYKDSLETSIKLNLNASNNWSVIVAMKMSLDCPLVSRELMSWPPWLVLLKWKLICQLSRALQCRYPIMHHPSYHFLISFCFFQRICTSIGTELVNNGNTWKSSYSIWFLQIIRISNSKMQCVLSQPGITVGLFYGLAL